MFKRRVKIYKAKDNDGNFIFPEQSELNIDPNKAAIALSGGGSRAFITSLALLKLLETKKLMKDISYISTVSGSGWIVAPYIYSEIEYGIYRKPENITMDRLSRDNYGTACDSIIDIDIYKHFRKLKKTSIPKEQYWNEIIADNFLLRYDLKDKIVSYSNERADYLESIVDSTCEIPNNNKPFWLANSSVLANSCPICITMTSIYSGLQSRVKINDKYLGGYMIETPFLNSKKPTNKIKDDEILVETSSIFTLNDMIGTSSEAFTVFLDEIEEKITNFFGSHIKVDVNYNSSYNLFDFKTKNESIVKIADGYSADNLGILPLLARGCKKIIAVSSNLEINNDDYLNSNLLPLFGLWTYSNGYKIDNSINDNSQVFDEKYWKYILRQIEIRKNNGGPVFINISLPVLPNRRHSIKGNYEVELLIYLLYPSERYIRELNNDVSYEIRKDGKLENFPNFKTTFQNEGKLCAYTREQTNILYYYFQWCLKETYELIEDFILNDLS